MQSLLFFRDFKLNKICFGEGAKGMLGTNLNSHKKYFLKITASGVYLTPFLKQQNVTLLYNQQALKNNTIYKTAFPFQSKLNTFTALSSSFQASASQKSFIEIEKFLRLFVLWTV